MWADFNALTDVAWRLCAVFLVLGILHPLFLVIAALILILWVLGMAHHFIEGLVDLYFDHKEKHDADRD